MVLAVMLMLGARRALRGSLLASRPTGVASASSASVPASASASTSATAISSSGIATGSNGGKQSYPQLVAEIRNPLLAGSSKMRVLRRTGKVPGVIYGIDEDQNVVKITIMVDEKDILTQIRERGMSLESTIYELHVKSEGASGGIQKHIVTPRQLQMNPITEKPLSLNFIKYWPGTRMRIPVEFINADLCVDLRRGSFLVRVNRFIECECDMEIPKSLVVDLATAQKGDVLKISQIVFPPNVKPSRTVPPDFVLGVIRTARGS